MRTTNPAAPAGVGGREAEGGGTRDAELEESEGIARPTSNAGSNAGVAVGQLRARMPQTGGRTSGGRAPTYAHRMRR